MQNGQEKIPSYKLAAVQYIIVAILLILLSALWRLQILGGQTYHVLAQQNRIRKVPILAPRGRLYDRYGRLLVDNYPSVSCFLVRESNRDLEPDYPLIARGLNMTVDEIKATVEHYRNSPRYQPIPLKQDITPDEQEFIAAHANELPELETIDEQRRLYPRDGFAAALIGYVGEVSESMLNQPRYAYYEPGDVVGKSGVEESYDGLLRGEDGSQDVIVDSRGRKVGLLGLEPATPGENMKLTIDLDLQRAAENALGPRSGAIVAMDPHTGEILALVSHPTFDPNQFAVRISQKDWMALITNPDHPLMDKAIQAQLAPGSTFKIIMAAAGLQEGIAQNLTVDCRGGADFYGRYFKCWRHGGHGETNITKAIWQSCDVYFYTLAEKLGIDKIAYWAHQFGLGQKTGIDLPDEASGVMPSPEWKMRLFHTKWYAGETISVGIGQGAVAVTPIQMARAIGGIASGGVFKRPHVVFPSEIPANYRQAMLDYFPGSGDKTVPLAPSTWETITDAMALVTGPGGTAASGHLQGIDFAGKTGSAQTMSNALAARMGHSHTMDDNAWFVGVTPRRNPDIVVCVLWQRGNHGTLAGRLAARVIEAYVDKQRRLHGNLEEAKTPQTVEVGAVWSDGDAPVPPGTGSGPKPGAQTGGSPDAAALAASLSSGRIHGGHFFLTVPPARSLREGAVR